MTRGYILYIPKGRALETAQFIAGQDENIWVCNHVKGCSHGCSYCYNPTIMKISREQFRTPELKGEDGVHVLNKVKRDINEYEDSIEWLYLCFSTDPYQDIAVVQETTNDIVALARDNDINVITLTKGCIDMNLVDSHDSFPDWYGITLVSTVNGFRKMHEPGAKTFMERVKSLRGMSDMGVPTFVSMEPYPVPQIQKQSLNNVLEAVSFVDKIIFGKWNYDYRAKGKLADEFYVEKAKEFIDFCENHNIQYKIKDDILRLM